MEPMFLRDVEAAETNSPFSNLIRHARQEGAVKDGNHQWKQPTKAGLAWPDRAATGSDSRLESSRPTMPV